MFTQQKQNNNNEVDTSIAMCTENLPMEGHPEKAHAHTCTHTDKKKDPPKRPKKEQLILRPCIGRPQFLNVNAPLPLPQQETTTILVTLMYLISGVGF